MFDTTSNVRAFTDNELRREAQMMITWNRGAARAMFSLWPKRRSVAHEALSESYDRLDQIKAEAHTRGVTLRPVPKQMFPISSVPTALFRPLWLRQLVAIVIGFALALAIFGSSLTADGPVRVVGVMLAPLCLFATRDLCLSYVRGTLDQIAAGYPEVI